MIANEPPNYLDEAKVIMWAWSGQEPFGFVGNIDNLDKEEIFGLAVCKYEDAEGIYRFSCDKNWNVVQDGYYDSLDKAIAQLPEQYKNVEIIWQTK